MQKQQRLFSLALVAVAVFTLAQPIALMAQTEPTPTLAQPASTPAQPASTPDPAAPPVPRVHVVQEGENLTTIATDYLSLIHI